MLVGGTIGALIVAIIFVVILLTPLNTMKTEITPSENSIPIIVEKIIPSENSITEEKIIPAYSKNLSLIEIFEKSEPGVVKITVKKIDQTNGTNALGSGFVFDKKGHIITNFHVIKNAKSVVVTFLDGRSYDAKVVGADEFTDLGVIKVDADLALLKPLSLGDSSNLKVGEPITAIGNPFGLSGSMTSGIVSQLGRLLPTGSGYSIPDVIQTDAAINPGNSGGPLLNMRGEIVGINTAIQSATGEFTGVGFAIPSQTIAKIVPNLIQNGKYDHPWIGISGKDIDPELAKILKLNEAVGFLVMKVVENSPAAKAGIHGSNSTVEVDGVKYQIGGDIVLSIDGKEVRKIDDILTHLQREKYVGDKMVLEIIRDGRTTSISITLEKRPNGN